MKIKKRVHVAPVGFEYDRIMEPALKLRADKIYLLHYNQSDAIETEFHQELWKNLEDNRVELEKVGCDIFDLYDSIGSIAEITSKHSRDDVYVNVSAGSKITAIGGMIACMTTDATAYYVKPDRYNVQEQTRDGIDDIQPVSVGVEEIEELPVYPIDSPERQEIMVLDYIMREGEVTKMDIIEYCENMELSFISDSEADSDKAKYRLLETHITEPLKTEGYICEEKVGRQRRISLTNAGENALRAFGFKMN
ncbi:MAG: DUF6293 family protein [Halobacteria archaeon]